MYRRCIETCAGEVVEGLDLGILKMNEDEVMEITVAPEYGFGDKEEKRPLGTVPPNSTLLYTVELLEVIKVCFSSLSVPSLLPGVGSGHIGLHLARECELLE